jgi:hypothetical protein
MLHEGGYHEQPRTCSPVLVQAGWVDGTPIERIAA